jgi:hypothetical protein
MMLMIVALAKAAAAMGLERRFLLAMFKRRPSIESRAFRGYTPTKHDVLAATWTKSGTNWIMQICQQIAWRGEAEFGHIHEVVAWPEVKLGGLVDFHDLTPQQASPTGLRVIKTHLPQRFVPYNEDATYFTIVRDPKEVFCSSFPFVRGLTGLEDRITLDLWVDLFLDPDGIGVRWAEHTSSWWALHEQANVLMLSFRAMKADLPAHVDRVAEVMGVSLSAAERDRVIERSGFSYMKEHELQFAAPRMPFARPERHPPMIRRGVAGGSDELLSRPQQAAIDSFCQKQLERLGSDFPYAEWFDVVE